MDQLSAACEVQERIQVLQEQLNEALAENKLLKGEGGKTAWAIGAAEAQRMLQALKESVDSTIIAADGGIKRTSCCFCKITLRLAQQQRLVLSDIEAAGCPSPLNHREHLNRPVYSQPEGSLQHSNLLRSSTASEDRFGTAHNSMRPGGSSASPEGYFCEPRSFTDTIVSTPTIEEVHSDEDQQLLSSNQEPSAPPPPNSSIVSFTVPCKKQRTSFKPAIDGRGKQLKTFRKFSSLTALSQTKHDDSNKPLKKRTAKWSIEGHRSVQDVKKQPEAQVPRKTCSQNLAYSGRFDAEGVQYETETQGIFGSQRTCHSHHLGEQVPQYEEDEDINVTSSQESPERCGREQKLMSEYHSFKAAAKKVRKRVMAAKDEVYGQIRKVSKNRRDAEVIEEHSIFCTGKNGHQYAATLKILKNGALRIHCLCSPKCQQEGTDKGLMIPSNFERHCGKGANKNWPYSIWTMVDGARVPVAKCQWLQPYLHRQPRFKSFAGEREQLVKLEEEGSSLNGSQFSGGGAITTCTALLPWVKPTSSSIYQRGAVGDMWQSWNVPSSAVASLSPSLCQGYSSLTPHTLSAVTL